MKRIAAATGLILALAAAAPALARDGRGGGWDGPRHGGWDHGCPPGPRPGPWYGPRHCPRPPYNAWWRGGWYTPPPPPPPVVCAPAPAVYPWYRPAPVWSPWAW